MMNSYTKMAQAIDWMVAHATEHPSLETVAAWFNYEPTYFQKLFKDHVGVSPKKFLQYMTYRRARDLLLQGYSTLDAAYEAGLSGQGRLHDLFMNVESMTPGSVAGRGLGIQITYGFAPSLFGELMIAKTDRGVCWLGFQMDEKRDRSIERMREFWPLGDFVEGDISTEVSAINALWLNGQSPNKIKLDLYGTNMQLQVWQALLKIPFGAVTDYGAIARSIGMPKAARAVGNAVGANPVSLLIPCHRVIQSTGILNNYGWGSERKKVILGIEGAHLNQ